MHVYGPGTANPSSTLPTLADGSFFFNVTQPGIYKVCEVQQPAGTPPPTWQQTFPQAGPGIVACGGAGEAPLGYEINVQVQIGGPNDTCCGGTTVTFTSIDFGNQKKEDVTCPEDPNRASKLTRTVGGGAGGGNGSAGSPINFHTLQAAYDVAKVSPITKDEVIGMFMKTDENVFLGNYSAKSMTLTQCTSAEITAKDASKPVWTLTGGPEAADHRPRLGRRHDRLVHRERWPRAQEHPLERRHRGGTAHQVRRELQQHLVQQRGEQRDRHRPPEQLEHAEERDDRPEHDRRPHRRRQHRQQRVGHDDPNNTDGVFVEGYSNTIKSNKLPKNYSNVVKVTGNTNTIEANGADENYGDAYDIAGTGNTVKDNKANKNVGVGFDLSGTGQKLTKSAPESNGGVAWRITGTPSAVVTGAVDNKANGSGIPSASKCPSFFSNAGGATCNP